MDKTFLIHVGIFLLIFLLLFSGSYFLSPVKIDVDGIKISEKDFKALISTQQIGTPFQFCSIQENKCIKLRRLR